MKTSHLFIKAVVGNNEKAATFAFWLPLPPPLLPLPPPPTPPSPCPPTSPPLVEVPRLHLQREQFELFEEGPASCHRWKSNLFSSIRCFVIFRYCQACCCKKEISEQFPPPVMPPQLPPLALSGKC